MAQGDPKEQDEATLRARIEELERSTSRLMQNLAHELATPITPLAGYIKILASDRVGTLSVQQRKIVEAMAASVGRLARIVDNLSDFASLEAGRAAIAPAPVDPDGLAQAAVDELRLAIKDARLHVQVLPSGAGMVMADPRKLKQAVANVVGNAVKFSPHGGEVLLEVQRHGDRLRFAVYDQGPGVKPADAEHIFEPLFHAKRADDSRQPGSGLGLPVARRIAEAHGGRILVESPPHAQPPAGGHHFTGCKFVIEILAPEAPAAQQPGAVA